MAYQNRVATRELLCRGCGVATSGDKPLLSPQRRILLWWQCWPEGITDNRNMADHHAPCGKTQLGRWHSSRYSRRQAANRKYVRVKSAGRSAAWDRRSRLPCAVWAAVCAAVCLVWSAIHHVTGCAPCHRLPCIVSLNSVADLLGLLTVILLPTV